MKFKYELNQIVNLHVMVESKMQTTMGRITERHTSEDDRGIVNKYRLVISNGDDYTQSESDLDEYNDPKDEAAKNTYYEPELKLKDLLKLIGEHVDMHVAGGELEDTESYGIKMKIGVPGDISEEDLEILKNIEMDDDLSAAVCDALVKHVKSENLEKQRFFFVDDYNMTEGGFPVYRRGTPFPIAVFPRPREKEARAYAELLNEGQKARSAENKGEEPQNAHLSCIFTALMPNV